MKQIILNVLKSMTKNYVVNLNSEATRKEIAESITVGLESNGIYKQHTEIELEKQEAKKDWVCQTCGKSTFETDYDYLVHPKLHLSCALEEEMKGKDIKEQYHAASARLYKDKNRQKDAESVEEPEGSPYTSEEIEAWHRAIEDCGTQQPYDKYRKK